MDTLITKKQKIEILLKRDGGYCVICQKVFKYRKEITLDHWIPRARGGSNDLDNLKLAHKKCNAWKGDRIPNEDGTIPPKPERVSHKDRKQRKQEALESLCEECYNGRLLLEGELCPKCGHPAGPEDWPHWAKKRADKCKHTSPEWCWACSIGIVDRKPVFLVLLEGN